MPIFNSFLEAVYPVGVKTNRSCFMQPISHNSGNHWQICTKVGMEIYFNAPVCVPSFSCKFDSSMLSHFIIAIFLSVSLMGKKLHSHYIRTSATQLLNREHIQYIVYYLIRAQLKSSSNSWCCHPCRNFLKRCEKTKKKTRRNLNKTLGSRILKIAGAICIKFGMYTHLPGGYLCS